MRRLVLPVVVGLLFATSLATFLTPGRFDLWPRAFSGLEAPDDGYWSAPARALAGEGAQDAYDHDLALSLALPQNALAAGAMSLGVPYRSARFAGSLLAAAALAAVGLSWWAGRARGAGAVLLAFLLAPPVLGHLASDLGEGTAIGLTVLWAAAALGRQWTLAGVLAAVALSQKAWGFALGVGTLAGTLLHPGRVRALVRAGVGALAGQALTIAVAVFVFHDDALAFVRRPWVATEDTAAGTHGLSTVVQAAFLGHHGVGRWLLPGFAAALGVATFSPPRRASAAVLVATVTGFLFAGRFPDPWRVVPVLPLLAACCVDERRHEAPALGAADARPVGWSLLPALCILPQAVGALVAWAGPARALTLVAATVAAGALLVVAVRLVGARPRVAATAGFALLCAAASAVASAHAVASRDDERVVLAREVVRRLPPDAHLIGYSFLAQTFRGTLYYPPFERSWDDEFAAHAPAVVYRLRVPHLEDVAGVPPPGPAGYAVTHVESLGGRVYNREDVPRPLLLETLERAR